VKPANSPFSPTFGLPPTICATSRTPLKTSTPSSTLSESLCLHPNPKSKKSLSRNSSA
jgi:hypothetical protein